MKPLKFDYLCTRVARHVECRDSGENDISKWYHQGAIDELEVVMEAMLGDEE